MSAAADAPDIAALRTKYPAAFTAQRKTRLRAGLVVAVMAAIYAAALVYFDIPWPKLIPGLRQLGWFLELMVPPDAGGHLFLYLNALGETLAIALLGTLLAALFALPLGVLAARNVIPTALVRLPLKRVFDTIRGVDTLIWALIWINVVGLGPFAGVLAIATSDFGALAKLFAEIVEAADAREPEGVRASGGSMAPTILDNALLIVDRRITRILAAYVDRPVASTPAELVAQDAARLLAKYRVKP